MRSLVPCVPSPLLHALCPGKEHGCPLCSPSARHGYSVPWAAHVACAHEDAGQRIMDFRRAPWKGNLANAIAHVGKVACGDFRSPLIHPPTLTDRRGLIWASARCWTSCRWGQATYIQEAVLLHQLLGGLGEVYMVIFESADSVTWTRLLTHSGHAWGRH